MRITETGIIGDYMNARLVAFIRTDRRRFTRAFPYASGERAAADQMARAWLASETARIAAVRPTLMRDLSGQI